MNGVTEGFKNATMSDSQVNRSGQVIHLENRSAAYCFSQKAGKKKIFELLSNSFYETIACNKKFLFCLTNSELTIPYEGNVSEMLY
jgi:hypothetical protein